MKEKDIQLISEMQNKPEATDQISLRIRKELNDKVNYIAKNSSLSKTEILNRIISIGLEELEKSGIKTS